MQPSSENAKNAVLKYFLSSFKYFAYSVILSLPFKDELTILFIYLLIKTTQLAGISIVEKFQFFYIQSLYAF